VRAGGCRLFPPGQACREGRAFRFRRLDVDLSAVQGGEEGVVITVHNMGAAIPGDQLDGLFIPMKSRKGRASAPAPRDSIPVRRAARIAAHTPRLLSKSGGGGREFFSPAAQNTWKPHQMHL
jgi:hypothetical protein